MWVKSSDITWVDQSPEVAETGWLSHLSPSKFRKPLGLFNLPVPSDSIKYTRNELQHYKPIHLPSPTFTWEHPKSDPIKDLEEAAKHLAEAGKQVNSAWERLQWPSLTTFYDEISADSDRSGTVPLDEYGRPVLNESGGIAKEVGPRYCPRGHGEMAPGGFCKRC